MPYRTSPTPRSAPKSAAKTKAPWAALLFGGTVFAAFAYFSNRSRVHEKNVFKRAGTETVRMTSAQVSARDAALSSFDPDLMGREAKAFQAAGFPHTAALLERGSVAAADIPLSVRAELAAATNRRDAGAIRAIIFRLAAGPGGIADVSRSTSEYLGAYADSLEK